MSTRLFTDAELGWIARETLPFISQWLMSGDIPLVARQVYRSTASELAPDLETVRKVIRLRFLIAQSEPLRRNLLEIEHFASTHRELQREEVVGLIRGRLDVHRYLMRRNRRDVPRRYPCLTVGRKIDTPENVLLCLTLLEVQQELIRLVGELRTDAVRGTSPVETVRAELEARAIQHVLTRPAWAIAVGRARRLQERYGGCPDYLRHDAMRRIKLGRMRRPSLYVKFLEWLMIYREHWALGLVDLAGAGQLLLYDSPGWYDRLFELFCTWKLAEVLARRLGQTPPEAQDCPLSQRHQGPIFRFDFPQPRSGGVLTLEIFFQRGSGVVWTPAAPPRAKLRTGMIILPEGEDEDAPAELFEEVRVQQGEQDKRYLVGIPDMVIRCSYKGQCVLFLIDFKNRRTVHQERNLILGYFFNFTPVMPYPAGCLLFRTANPRQEEVWDLDPGVLGVFFAGPSDNPQVSLAPFEKVVGLLNEVCKVQLGARFL